MTQTIQSISHALVEKAKIQHTMSSSSYIYSEKPEPSPVTEESMRLLLSIFDSMSNLCIALKKLEHAAKITNIELHNKLINKEG